MPMKGGDTDDYREINRWDRGVGWLAHPEETMQRASHALVGDGGGVWVIDPVDVPEIDALVSEFGDVAGVVVGLDRHKRDVATFARRHDAPVYVPQWMTGVAGELDAPVERFEVALEASGFEAFRIRDSTVPPWQEVGLFHPDDGTLVVPEALGTVAYFCAPGERLGVHPMLRPTPPRRALSRFEPERVLVGHGAGVTTDATTALRDALANARRNLPGAYGRALRSLLS